MTRTRKLRLLALALIVAGLAGVALQLGVPAFDGSALFVVFTVVGVAMLIDLRPRR